jgi:hypothetical protein
MAWRRSVSGSLMGKLRRRGFARRIFLQGSDAEML